MRSCTLRLWLVKADFQIAMFKIKVLLSYDKTDAALSQCRAHSEVKVNAVACCPLCLVATAQFC